MTKGETNEVMAVLIDQIVTALNKKGLVHKDLADELGVSQQRVSQILSGRYNITVKTLSRIAKALDLKLKIELYG
jgi:transcriptional regulator with XRE-family HTH domain